MCYCRQKIINNTYHVKTWNTFQKIYGAEVFWLGVFVMIYFIKKQ